MKNINETIVSEIIRDLASNLIGALAARPAYRVEKDASGGALPANDAGDRQTTGYLISATAARRAGLCMQTHARLVATRDAWRAMSDFRDGGVNAGALIAEAVAAKVAKAIQPKAKKADSPAA